MEKDHSLTVKINKTSSEVEIYRPNNDLLTSKKLTNDVNWEEIVNFIGDIIMIDLSSDHGLLPKRNPLFRKNKFQKKESESLYFTRKFTAIRQREKIEIIIYFYKPIQCDDGYYESRCSIKLDKDIKEFNILGVDELDAFFRSVLKIKTYLQYYRSNFVEKITWLEDDEIGLNL